MSSTFLPEGYSAWVLAEDIETDTPNIPDLPPNIIGTDVDASGKPSAILICDRCPCTSRCWWLYRSTCSKLDPDPYDDVLEQEVEWSAPELVEIHCIPDPDIINMWFWVAPGEMNIWVTNDKPCYQSSPKCDITDTPNNGTEGAGSTEPTYNPPPTPDKPTSTTCCQFIGLTNPFNANDTIRDSAYDISFSIGGELPYILKSKQYPDIDPETGQQKTDPDTGLPVFITYTYKVYSDIELSDNRVIASMSCGELEWGEYTIDCSMLSNAAIHKKIYFYDKEKTKTEQIAGDPDGAPVGFTHSEMLSPTWRMDLILTTSVAASYNAIHENPPVGWPGSHKPHTPAMWLIKDVIESNLCFQYHYVVITANCSRAANIPGCSILTPPEKQDDAAYVASIKSSYEVWPPFPFNSTDSGLLHVVNRSTLVSAWMHPVTTGQGTVDSSKPYRRLQTGDLEAYKLIMLGAPAAIEWRKAGGTEFLYPEACTNPFTAALPRLSKLGVWESSEPNPDLEEYFVSLYFSPVSAIPALHCCQDYSEVLDSWVNAYTRAKHCYDKDSIKACPGAHWRVIDVGNGTTQRQYAIGWTHSSWNREDTKCCTDTECDDEDRDFRCYSCAPEDKIIEAPTGCWISYEGGTVNNDGNLVGLPDCFEHAYCYEGFMELQAACIDSETGDLKWPPCADEREEQTEK